MGVLARPSGWSVQAGPSHWDDYWYQPAERATSAGQPVTTRSALEMSVIYAGVNLIANTVATLPLITYERLPGGGRERARGHPLYHVLHDQPNPVHTATEFWRWMVAVAALRGEAYAHIRWQSRDWFGPQLIPLNPDTLVDVELDEVRYRARYLFRDPRTGQTLKFNQEDILPLRRWSTDGLRGLGIVSAARESIGLGQAIQQYGARFFRQGARPGGLLQSDAAISEGREREIRESWQAAHSGPENWHKVAVIGGLKWQAIGVTNEEAQFLETKSATNEDFVRFLGVPPHMVGVRMEKASYASREMDEMHLATHSILPWTRLIEQSVSSQMIENTDRFYTEFLFDALLRATTTDRFSAYQTAIQNTIMTPAEARMKENLGPRPELDRFMMPKNMRWADEPDDTPDTFTRGPGTARADLLALHAANGVIRREQDRVTALARRYANDPAGYETAIDEFYREHTAYLIEKFNLRPGDARGYCEPHQTRVKSDGLKSVEGWNDEVEALASLILGESHG